MKLCTTVIMDFFFLFWVGSEGSFFIFVSCYYFFLKNLINSFQVDYFSNILKAIKICFHRLNAKLII